MKRERDEWKYVSGTRGFDDGNLEFRKLDIDRPIDKAKVRAGGGVLGL